MKTKPTIQDQFTKLNVSRQRKKQLRYKAQGRCILCGATALTRGYCLSHLIAVRERARNYHKAKRRNLNSKSYQLQSKLDPQAVQRYRLGHEKTQTAPG